MTTSVLITGANSGIGYQTALSLLRSTKTTYKIFVGARSIEKASSAVVSLKDEAKDTKSDVSPLVVDLEDDESIKKAFEEVSGKIDKLDVLVNNAGINIDMQGLKEGLTDRQIFNKSWDVNVTGTQIITKTFVPLLIKSTNPRLIFLTTSMSSLTISEYPQPHFNQSPPAGWPKQNPDFWSYKSTKLGLVMIMRDWYKTLKNDNVKTWAINPGLVATNLGGDPDFLKAIGAGDPAVSGNLVISVIEGGRDNDVGKMLGAKEDIFGDIVPW
ncbi:uncharacterized protein IL334_003583 [Kwoniella shivajii]|uniref:Short-chain dehydrogenase n=1 Tax=Kwoniella shivajii TaxID=564305 RepID=A0ABZ1CXZ8_9TREE|nr:hypothetical protein IL334_003583 [Kwoniella shivajii]